MKFGKTENMHDKNFKVTVNVPVQELLNSVCASDLLDLICHLEEGAQDIGFSTDIITRIIASIAKELRSYPDEYLRFSEDVKFSLKDGENNHNPLQYLLKFQ